MLGRQTGGQAVEKQVVGQTGIQAVKKQAVGQTDRYSGSQTDRYSASYERQEVS